MTKRRRGGRGAWKVISEMLGEIDDEIPLGVVAAVLISGLSLVIFIGLGSAMKLFLLSVTLIAVIIAVMLFLG